MAERATSRLWLAALGAFVLAGLTGSLLRWGLIVGMPQGLLWNNVRHAHSHLMYFSWVTPALIALIAAHLSRIVGPARVKRLVHMGVLALVLGLLAYPFFLLYGYTPVPLFNARIPLSTVISSLNMLVWYVFVVLYRRITRGVTRTLPLRFWDAALVFMVLASVGAWARAALVAAHVESPFLENAAVYLFLGEFSDGWFVLGVLGLAHALFRHEREATASMGRNIMIAGLPVVFLLGVPLQVVPPGLRLIAGIGGFLVAIGTLFNVLALWPSSQEHFGWRVALFFLGVKAVAQWLATSPAVAMWAESVGLRVPYLHVLLLGFVTLGLISGAELMWWPRARLASPWMTVGVALLIVCMLPLARLGPSGWGKGWAPVFAAVTSLGPVLVASWSGVYWLRTPVGHPQKR